MMETFPIHLNKNQFPYKSIFEKRWLLYTVKYAFANYRKYLKEWCRNSLLYSIQQYVTVSYNEEIF